MTTATYEISNTTSGHSLGEYEGADELAAYNAMLEMAGAESVEDEADIPADIQITEVETD